MLGDAEDTTPMNDHDHCAGWGKRGGGETRAVRVDQNTSGFVIRRIMLFVV